MLRAGSRSCLRDREAAPAPRSTPRPAARRECPPQTGELRTAMMCLVHAHSLARDQRRTASRPGNPKMPTTTRMPACTSGAPSTLGSGPCSARQARMSAVALRHWVPGGHSRGSCGQPPTANANGCTTSETDIRAPKMPAWRPCPISSTGSEPSSRRAAAAAHLRNERAREIRRRHCIRSRLWASAICSSPRRAGLVASARSARSSSGARRPTGRCTGRVRCGRGWSCRSMRARGRCCADWSAMPRSAAMPAAG